MISTEGSWRDKHPFYEILVLTRELRVRVQ
jgi:hypothetical protein